MIWKQSWGILKNIINKNQKPHTQSRFKIGDNLITSDKKVICNRFNDFFDITGPTLAKSITKANKSPLSYMGNRLTEFIYLEPVTEEEMNTLISALNDTATGFYNINPMSLKISFKILVKPLTNICNLSLSQEISRVSWKLQMSFPCTKVMTPCCLIFTGLLLECVFFRSFFCKMMYTRVITFLEIFKVLDDNQYSFRKQSSTYLSLFSFIDKMIQTTEKGEYVIGIFLDFFKAFDTIDHDIMLDKLDYVGIRGCALVWFKSYWNQRLCSFLL